MAAPKRGFVNRALGLFGRGDGRGRLGSDIALDDDVTHLRRDSTSPPASHVASKSIEVQTAVNQRVDVEEGKGGFVLGERC